MKYFGREENYLFENHLSTIFNKFKNAHTRILHLSKPLLMLLAVLMCALLALASWTSILTYSSFAKSLEHSFTLNTSNFFFEASIEPKALTINKASQFTEESNLSVRNFMEDIEENTTSSDIEYTITSKENGTTTPRFDLFIGNDLATATQCVDNTTIGALSAGSMKTNTHKLYFKLKDSETASGTYPVKIEIKSSKPYERMYNFTLNIEVPANDMDGMILIPGTDIYRPDVPITSGSILVFKDNEYVYLTPADLLNQLVIDNHLQDGSLYIPASIGAIEIERNASNNWSPTIDWDVYGDIIIEANIKVNVHTSVVMKSHNGDVIMNGINMTGGNNNPFKVEIIAENGGVKADGAVISSVSDGNGKISLVARDSINISGAALKSSGNYGINIQSSEGGINAPKANIESTNGAGTAGIKLESLGLINLDKATVKSNVFITINGSQGISAQSAKISNSAYGKNINMASSNGSINLSSFATPEPKTQVQSASANIYITAKEHISIESAIISASMNYGMELRFKSTGPTGSINNLWLNNAKVNGHSINAYNLSKMGTLANGSGTINWNP